MSDRPETASPGTSAASWPRAYRIIEAARTSSIIDSRVAIHLALRAFDLDVLGPCVRVLSRANRDAEVRLSLAEYINLAVQFGVALQVFTFGMHTELGDLRYLPHRPRRFLRSAAAIYVVTPLVMVAVLSLLEMPGRVKLAILLLSFAPGAPLTPGQASGAGGNRAYAFSLMLWIAFAAVVTVPASVGILARIFGFQSEITMLQVARHVAALHFGPLMLGIALAALAPAITRRVTPFLRTANSAVVYGLMAVVLIAFAGSLEEIGLSGTIGLLLFGVLTMLIGHLMGGERQDTKAALAMINSSRTPGTAVLIATVSFGALRLVPIIFSYLLFVQLLGALYVRWMRKRTVGDALRVPSSSPAR